MPANDVIQRTEQLIRSLRDLASASDDTGAKLSKLIGIVQQIQGLNLTNIKETSTYIANFNRELKAMGGESAQVNQINTAFLDLTRTIESANTVISQFSAMSKMSTGVRRARNIPLGPEESKEEWMSAWKQQSKIYNEQKLIASQSRKALQDAERIWQENLIYAQGISQLRNLVIRNLNLYGGGIIPQLPPGAIGKEPTLLPAGQQVARLQLPARIPTYEDYEQQQAQQQEYYKSLYKRPLLLPSGPIPAATTGAEFDARTFKEQTGQTDEYTESLKRLKYTEEEIKRVIPFDEKSLRGYGLSQTAAINLSKELKNLGMSQGIVTHASTEMSTGITTVSIAAKDGTNVIRNFTAHLDRNGNVLQDTQKRFRSFGSAVMRDIVEVLKWTIAITAIYTPIRKLGELLDQMKKIQLDMVDVQIVLGDSTRQFATVLEASSQIATETSSTLEGVIEGYSLAAAAAASAGDETQRTVVTQMMLKDSMVLSKLANIDQKQALDTLVGSLSQLGMNLTQGTQLLDSWVAVSKKANVSVNQMATSFTIVGSAAQEAGVNYNELNALIGALAQSTNLSADELGNAIRGIIAAMQTDKAQQAFAEYGIATKTVSGDFRDLMDILKQMKQMSETGILDEKAMGALTQAGGAGARRGAQLSALVKNLDTVMNLITISENASGDAAQALGLEMGTLDAAATRLNNAFSELAVTLGTEGGVLGFLTAITNAVTSLVRGIKDLTNVLKIAAPILATFMLARGIMGTPTGAGLLNKNIPRSLANMFLSTQFLGFNQAGETLTGNWAPIKGAPLTNWLLGKTRATGIGGRYTKEFEETGIPIARTATIGEFFSGFWNRINMPFAQMYAQRKGLEAPPALAMGLNKVSLGTLLGPLLMAGSSLISGGPGAGTRATISGGVGLLAAAITGSGMWATVGSIIATAFYDKFLTFTEDMTTTWATKIVEARETREGKGTPESDLTILNKQARESMSGMETLKINILTWMMNTWASMPWRASTSFAGKKVTPEETLLGVAIRPTKEPSLLQKILFGMAAPMLDEETKKKVLDAYNKLLRNLAEGTQEVTIVPTSQQEEIARLAATASADVMNKALEQMSLGAEGSIQNYLDAKSLAQKIGSTVNGLIDTQMLMMQPVTLGVGATAKTITPAPAGFKPMTSEEAVKFISGLNAKESSAIVSYYTEIKDLLEKIKVLNEQIAKEPGGIATKEQQKDLDTYAARLTTLPQEFIQVQQAIQQGTVYRKIEEKFLPTIELPEMTPQQFAQVEAQAERYWREYLKASGLTQDEINTFIKNQDEAIVTMQGRITPFRTNIPMEQFTPALEEKGITGQQPGLIEWQQYTKAQFLQAQSMYQPFIQAIQKILPTWKPEESEALYFLKDDAITAHLDQSILQMLMRDLIDVEKEKGLQGMYNLPAGATFYIPATAYEMSKATVTEIAGGSGNMQTIMNYIQMLNDLYNAQKEKAPIDEHRQAMIERNRGEGAYRMTPTSIEGLLPYSVGNPLPVMITNWIAQGGQVPNGTLGNWDVYANPQQPVIPNGTLGNYGVPTQESPLPTWLQWAEEIGPAIGKISDFIGKLFSAEKFDYGIPNAGYVPQTQQPPITTALNLSVDSNIVLTVDGRTLATIIKPYLYEDMIRYMTSANSSINRSIVA